MDELVARIMTAQTAFRRACNQIMILNRIISDMQKRYEQAMKQHARAFRYSQRVRIAIMEGVRNMFYMYAQQKADLVLQLREQIQLEHEYVTATEDDLENEDESHDYVDEYDLSDSELEYSDFDFSDFESENETDLDTSFFVENVETTNASINKADKVDSEKDLNSTEISVDSAFLDGSIADDESFSL